MNSAAQERLSAPGRERLPPPAMRWLPAILLMALIFGLSSIPSSEMPSFGIWDKVVKKSGHAIGYGLLALAYWRALAWRNNKWGLALALALTYAISDEAHQAFVPGRHASVTDALLVDGGGALLALLLARHWRGRRSRRP